MTQPKPTWIGIVMAYADGQAVAVQMEGEDLIGLPVIEPLVADGDDVIAFADLARSYGPLTSGVSMHLATRRLTAWYVGRAYAQARARHRLPDSPREITGG